MDDLRKRLEAKIEREGDRLYENYGDYEPNMNCYRKGAHALAEPLLKAMDALENLCRCKGGWSSEYVEHCLACEATSEISAWLEEE